MSRKQISVKLEPELAKFAEDQARQQDRTVAGQIRHFVAEAQRRASASQQRVEAR